MTKEALIKLKEKLSKLSEEEKKQRDLYLRSLANGELQGPPVGYASIDKPWLKYYSEEKIVDSIPECSIYQYAYNANKDNLDKVALDIRFSKNGFKKGIKITYKEFFENIEKCVRGLLSLGVQKDEIVPLIIPNLPEARYLIYACNYIGAISYPISPLLPSNELDRIVKENNIKNAFIFEGFNEKYSGVLEKNNVNAINVKGTESLPFFLKLLSGTSTNKNENNYENFIKKGRTYKKEISPVYYDNHVAAIIGTSGTTGTSKGVCLTDKNINCVGHAYKNGEYFEGNFMDALIPSIGYGISMIHYQTVASRYVYLIPELITDLFPKALEATKANNFPGGPVHSINLAKQNVKKEDIPYAENVISGGASLPSKIEEKLNNASAGYAENGKINDKLIVRQGYGLSENTAMGTFSKKGSYKFGSIGIPIIYENIGVFEPNTENELGYNEPGEICISGESVMKEYLNNASETEKVISINHDGTRWIHTKDIGYIDKDGNIFHVDRIKNIFMRTGFNVHPAKIAEFLNGIDLVEDNAVVGFEHPKEQCVPVAFIKLDKEKTKGKTEEEIREIINNYCYTNLEETSIPYEIRFVDELPLNSGGKIDVQKLKNESKIDYNKEVKILTLNKK